MLSVFQKKRHIQCGVFLLPFEQGCDSREQKIVRPVGFKENTESLEFAEYT
jgi:hypothetical protein